MWDRLADLPLSRAIGDHIAVFAAVESLHLVAIAVLGGTALISGLSGAGLLLRQVPAPLLQRGLRWPYALGLLAAAASGFLLFSTSPRKYLSNPVFTAKLALLAAALLVQWLLSRRVRRVGIDRVSRLFAATSLLLWLGVVTAGRWIGLI